MTQTIQLASIDVFIVSGPTEGVLNLQHSPEFDFCLSFLLLSVQQSRAPAEAESAHNRVSGFNLESGLAN